MKSPMPGAPASMWLNVMVEDIKNILNKALSAGCKEIQPVTQMETYGISNAIFLDPFGYSWLLHQLHHDDSFAEREAIWKQGAEEAQKLDKL